MRINSVLVNFKLSSIEEATCLDFDSPKLAISSREYFLLCIDIPSGLLTNSIPKKYILSPCS